MKNVIIELAPHRKEYPSWSSSGINGGEDLAALTVVPNHRLLDIDVIRAATTGGLEFCVLRRVRNRGAGSGDAESFR